MKKIITIFAVLLTLGLSAQTDTTYTKIDDRAVVETITVTVCDSVMVDSVMTLECTTTKTEEMYKLAEVKATIQRLNQTIPDLIAYKKHMVKIKGIIKDD